MSIKDDIPSADYADNPAPRLPCVIIVDGSGSMAEINEKGERRIDQLNEGLQTLEVELKKDPATLTGVGLKVIRAGGIVEDLVDWTDVKDFVAPLVQASGGTPLGSAVERALNEIEVEKQRMDAASIIRKRAWLFIFTDGAPTDDNWESVAKRCRAMENSKAVSVYGIGVDGANFENLAQFSDVNPPAKLRGATLKAFFKFLSASAKAGVMAPQGAKANNNNPQSPWIFPT